MKPQTRYSIQCLLRLIRQRMAGNPNGMLTSDVPHMLRKYVQPAKQFGVVWPNGNRLLCNRGQGFASPSECPVPNRQTRMDRTSTTQFLLDRAAFCRWAKSMPHAAYIRSRAHELELNDTAGLRALEERVRAYYAQR